MPATNPTHADLIEKAKDAIAAVHGDTSVGKEQTRDDLADLSNYIDDMMRAIDADVERDMEEAGRDSEDA
jgi:hypothetical protein